MPGSRLTRLAATASVLMISASALANNVGNWTGSARSWNHGDMATMRNTAIGAGHTVEADSAMTPGNLANDTHYVLGEPAVPSGAEITALNNWVRGGGILMLLVDSGDSGGAGARAVLGGIGSSITINAQGAPVNGPLQPGIFASEGPPYNIVGQTLAVTPGTEAAGGNMLAGTYVRWERLGSGYVFAFADRLDHNFFNPTPGNVNGKLFLNILQAPEPGSLALLGLGSLLAMRRR